MSPDRIRVLLIVLGVLLVVGIYLWDRFKRATPPGQARRARPEPQRAPDPAAVAERGGAFRVGETTDAATAGDHAPAIADELDPEPHDIGEWSSTGRDEESQIPMDLNFDAHGDSDYLHVDPALQDEVERKIVVINIVARGDSFGGAAIASACAAAGLRLGEMSIYHHHDRASGQVLFSMASMVEPGVFPENDDDFSTPGLSLFTQLPGARDGVVIYDTMLAAAKQLAGLLDGELRDDRRNKLTRQMEEHLRESIIEHRRRLNLARSRH